MFMFNSNEPIKVAHHQKLANQSLLNDARVMEMVNNSFTESIVIRADDYAESKKKNNK